MNQKIKLLPLNDRILLSITYLHSLQQLCGGFSHVFFFCLLLTLGHGFASNCYATGVLALHTLTLVRGRTSLMSYFDQLVSIPQNSRSSEAMYSS